MWAGLKLGGPQLGGFPFGCPLKPTKTKYPQKADPAKTCLLEPVVVGILSIGKGTANTAP